MTRIQKFLKIVFERFCLSNERNRQKMIQRSWIRRLNFWILSRELTKYTKPWEPQTWTHTQIITFWEVTKNIKTRKKEITRTYRSLISCFDASHERIVAVLAAFEGKILSHKALNINIHKWVQVQTFCSCNLKFISSAILR